MSDTAHLWLFFGLVFGIVILPGMDMAFVLGSALVGGRRTGLAAVAGLIAGGVCHVAMGATGLAVLLALVPSAFNAHAVAGALYVAWIGWDSGGSRKGWPSKDHARSFRRARPSRAPR